MKKKMYLKNVVNICIIYDLFYPPANNQNASFLLYPQRPWYNRDRTSLLRFVLSVV